MFNINSLIRISTLGLLVALAPLGCSDDDPVTGKDQGVTDGKVGDATVGDGSSGEGTITGDGGGSQCKHTVWAKGTKAFKESTSWKLESTSSVRLSVADIDGDGWADIVSRYSKNHQVLRNTGKGAFEDVTTKSKLFASRTATTDRQVDPVSFGDVDNDGDLDAFTGVASSLKDTSELMINDGKGVFSLGDKANPIRMEGKPANPAGGAFLDYNLDGKLDIFIPHNGSGSTVATIAHQDRLYQGDGKGGFTDVTTAAGLTTTPWSSLADLNAAKSHARSWGVLACDLNDDGLPELLVPSYGRSPNHLWQAKSSSGTVTYTNRSVASGYAFDNDKNWKDNQFARCYCKANPTAQDCSGVAAPLVSCGTPNWSHSQDRQDFRLGGNSALASCADFNNDGYMDLLTGEIRHWWAGSGSDGSEVLVNGGKSDVTFTRPGDKALGLEIAKSGVSWDEGQMSNVVFDFDNDGLLDIYQGDSDYDKTRGRLYHQKKTSGKTLSFEEVPMTDAIDHNRSHGVAAADFDRDGDLDLVVGHSKARCGTSGECYKDSRIRFFENVIGNKNAWIQLKLVGDGKTANKAAIGARVQVTACGMTQTQQVNGGYGHFGAQDDMVLHFGAGDATKVKVTVRWPNSAKTIETYTLDTRKRYTVEQGKTPTEAKK